MSTHKSLTELINSVLYDEIVPLEHRFDLMTDIVEPLITKAYVLGLTTIKPIYELTADDLI